jgi:hypothetical protein
MINKKRLEIEKIYQKIDKIAKVGSENFIEYYLYVDTLIRTQQYYKLLECLDLKYKFDAQYKDLATIKKESWRFILSSTLSPYQDTYKKLLKSKKVYQNGLYYYNDVQRTTAKVIDLIGTGAELEPIVVDGGVTSIKVVRTGSSYSASASVVITGGIGTASATASVFGGRVMKVTVGQTGSYHNIFLKLGKITETDEYKTDIGENTLSPEILQKISKNKTTYLVATKTGATFSATFSSWNYTYTYDKNLINLYSSAIDYLIN